MVLSVAGTFPAPAVGVRGTFLLLVWGGGWQGGDKPSSPFPEAAAIVAVPPKPVSVVLLLLWRVGGPCGTGLQLTAVPGAGGVLGAADAHGEWVMPVGYGWCLWVSGSPSTPLWPEECCAQGMRTSPAPSSAPAPRGSAHSHGSCGRSGVCPARRALGLRQWGRALLPPLPRARLGWGHGEGRQC